MSDLADRFTEFLDGKPNEHQCQQYLERHSELLYLPFMLNHHLHLGAVISKLPLDTSLVTDFAYLTKSSAEWYLVLIELESPSKRLFRHARGRVVPTAYLSDSIAQIQSWQEFLRENSRGLLERIRPLLLGMAHNPISFKYVLVIGRRNELKASEPARRRLANLNKADVHICTYDSLASAFKEHPSGRTRPLVLRYRGGKYAALHDPDPVSLGYLLDSVGPANVSLTSTQRKRLAEDGYPVDRWLRGERPLHIYRWDHRSSRLIREKRLQ